MFLAYQLQTCDKNLYPNLVISLLTILVSVLSTASSSTQVRNNNIRVVDSNGTSSKILLHQSIYLNMDGNANFYTDSTEDQLNYNTKNAYYTELITKLKTSPNRRKVRSVPADYPMESYLTSCNASLDVYPDKILRIISPFHGENQYPSGIDCEWEIQGYNQCALIVNCDVLDLRKSDVCSNDHDILTISDGIEGEVQFCGPQLGFATPFSSRSSHLFIAFRTGESTYFDRLYKGVQCHVRCLQAAAVSSRRLPEAELVKEENSCLCGRKYDEGKTRMVEGTTAEKREFPWQAAIVIKGTRQSICGGSLINDRYILTAAHCFTDPKRFAQSEVLIRAHTVDRSLLENADEVPSGDNETIKGSSEDKDETRLELKALTCNRLYNKYAPFDSDICLLKLAKPLNFKLPDTPVPICLPDPEDVNKNYAGTNATVTGWGSANELEGTAIKVLKKLDLPIIETSQCKVMFGNTVALSANMICAGFQKGGKDDKACHGDTGGPLITKNGDRWIQIGVVSYGDGCARENRPAIYSHVANFLAWIRYRTKGATWCLPKPAS